jgi:hypothetical protein
MRAATSEEMTRVSSLRVAGGQRAPSLSPPGISRGDPQFLKKKLLVDNFSQFFDLKKKLPKFARFLQQVSAGSQNMKSIHKSFYFHSWSIAKYG